MESDTQTYSLDELAVTSGINARTIRYYIQLGLVDPPEGQTRAARYTWQHLRQLLEVRRLTEQGLSLERVKAQLSAPPAPSTDTPQARRPGQIDIRTHIHLAPGLELVVEPGLSNLSSAQLRLLARDLLAVYVRHIEKQDVSPDSAANSTKGGND